MYSSSYTIILNNVKTPPAYCLQSPYNLDPPSFTYINMDDDLTASHWDDVLAPSQTQFSSSTYDGFGNRFGTLSLDNPHKDDDDDDDNNSDDGKSDANEGDDDDQPSTKAPIDQFASSSVFNQAEIDQLNEIQKEERKEKSSNLLTELTHGMEENDLETALQSPTKVTPSDSLFSDRGTPLKVPTSEGRPATEVLTSPTKSAKLKNGKFRATRSRRYPSKTVVKNLKENNADATDPLGPLGGSSGADGSTHENILSTRGETLLQEANAPLYDIASQPEQESVTKVDAPLATTTNEQTYPSDANVLDITVGDPIKVGDITNAHIVYSIRTKNKNDHTLHFPQTQEPVTVSRRYKDFRWIYHQLQNNHPGRIIPPPPTKQTYIGRFNESFIENRRLSLEKMLTKISKVVDFANDQDFVMFLTSEDFTNESKERERISGSGASSHPDLDDDSENGSVSSTASTPLVSGAAATSFMSSLFSISTKAPEPDEYFSKKKAYIEDLEYNLKTFYKSLELIATQRVEIMGVTEEISSTIDALADLEILKTTSDLLGEFAEVHLKLRENLDRVNLLDQLTLGFTIEEYLRIIGSVKSVFEARSKIYQQYITYKNDLTKKQESLDKLNSKYKSSVDKINLLTFEVDKLKQKVTQFEKSFNNISDTIKSEIDKFEMDKIEDFRNSVEIFIESSIESQKQSIELWETFYDRQNLAQI